MIWFTADLHFGHRNIIKHHPGRGDSLDEMHDRLITAWNDTVSARDDVWVLGDFAMGPSADVPRYFMALRGRKHLVVGNHDHGPTRRLPWTTVHDIYEWKQKPHRAVLCHYPLLTWNGAHHGVWMLHGHSHGLLGPTTNTRMDVGVDCHPEMRPFSLDEVEADMAHREYVVVDGHRKDAG